MDFCAADGKPVQVLFTLLSPSVQRHLQVLSELAFLLHDVSLRGMLREQAQANAILGRVRELEGGMASAR